ncbi:hypothetical protein K439DRAFT_1615110 [Ramaria rubella]|nr:hypothetical protein K439DRAFT_1615110 [Ramaria rubella]
MDRADEECNVVATLWLVLLGGLFGSGVWGYAAHGRTRNGPRWEHEALGGVQQSNAEQSRAKHAQRRASLQRADHSAAHIRGARSGITSSREARAAQRGHRPEKPTPCGPATWRIGTGTDQGPARN